MSGTNGAHWGPPSSPSASEAFGMTQSGLSTCLFRGAGRGEHSSVLVARVLSREGGSVRCWQEAERVMEGTSLGGLTDQSTW